MDFSRQEYWNGLPFPSPGDLPDPGLKPGSPTLQADALLPEPPGNTGARGSAISACSCHRQLKIQKMCFFYTKESIYHLRKARLQQYMNRELPDVQAGFRIGRGTRDEIAGLLKSKRVPETSVSALLTIPKPLTVWITINCGTF